MTIDQMSSMFFTLDICVPERYNKTVVFKNNSIYREY